MDKSKWEYKPFEDCIEKSKKTKRLMTSDYQPEGSYPIISQEASLISGYTDDADYVNHYDRPIIVFGDHTRVLKYVDFDFAVGADGVKILIPNATLNAKFLLNYLTWYKIPNLGYSRHYKLLKDISIPIPPISDQQRIVAELDCLNEMIALKQEQLKEFNKLAQSIFYDMFGRGCSQQQWEYTTIGNISEEVKYGTSSPASPNGRYKYLRMNNMTNDGYLDLSDLKYIDITANDYEKYVVRKGDVLFNRTNSRELVGKTALFNYDEEMIIAGYIIRVRLKTTADPCFVVRYMNLPEQKDYLRGLCRGAIGQANINAKELQAIPIPLPPLALQQQFAEKIQAIEAQKELVKQSIAETQQLLDSRMDYYFD